MNDLDKIWKNVLGDLKIELSQGSFSLIKPTLLLAIGDDTATIAVHSAVVINLIKKFESVIIAALEKHTGKQLQLTYVPKTITKEQKKEKPMPLFPKEEPVKKMIGHLPRVRSDYTFETLAVSESNKLAFVSAQNVAKHLGTAYNPFFIYGPVGVGKTHLMQAIANEVYMKNPDLKIVYITSEEFTNEVIEAIRSNDTARMKKKFRSANLLIIDDVQFIAGKDKVQEELFHTFNFLIDNRSQIALSSDKPPSEIKKLEKRLSSRFAGGLTVDIEAPDFETRTAIALKKAEKFGYMLPIDVAKMIAEKEQDVRSLEGSLMKVITTAQNQGSTITESIAKEALSNQGKEEKKTTRLRADDVIKLVCEKYDIKTTQIKGKKRDAYLVKARQIAMYLLYTELKMTHTEIGNQLGGRDHTTVMHGVEKMGKILSEKIPPSEDIMGISRQLQG